MIAMITNDLKGFGRDWVTLERVRDMDKKIIPGLPCASPFPPQGKDQLEANCHLDASRIHIALRRPSSLAIIIDRTPGGAENREGTVFHHSFPMLANRQVFSFRFFTVFSHFKLCATTTNNLRFLLAFHRLRSTGHFLLAMKSSEKNPNKSF